MMQAILKLAADKVCMQRYREQFILTTLDRTLKAYLMCLLKG